jgi:hypothetical protein
MYMEKLGSQARKTQGNSVWVVKLVIFLLCPEDETTAGGGGWLASYDGRTSEVYKAPDDPGTRRETGEQCLACVVVIELPGD